jgi:tetratricopeptide (TPR) repeat protein
MKKALAHRCYRLGLSAAQQRDLSAALRYAQYASVMDPENDDASLLAEICRRELGYRPSALPPGVEQIPAQAAVLMKQKKWSAAARVLEKVPEQSVRCVCIQGCLWALAKRRTLSLDCFARALEKDRGNPLALEAIRELGSQRCVQIKRLFFWRFF